LNNKGLLNSAISVKILLEALSVTSLDKRTSITAFPCPFLAICHALVYLFTYVLASAWDRNMETWWMMLSAAVTFPIETVKQAALLLRG